MFNVEFRFEDGSVKSAQAGPSENILDIARKINVAIDAPCSGNASCGKCRVKLISGDLDSPKTRHLSEEEYAQGWRLSCVSIPKSDVVVSVPDIASAYKSRMKSADLSSEDEVRLFISMKEQMKEAGIELKSALNVLTVEMSAPSLDDTMPDIERLERAVASASKVQSVTILYSVLKKMPDKLREHDFKVKCLIGRYGGRVFVYDLFGIDEKVTAGGLVVDIGTTTVSALIIDMLTGDILAKATTGNGQIRYGADVINRIIESRKPGGEKKLQDAVIKETINPLIHTMCESAGITGDRIYRMSVGANTTMNHLFAGINAEPLRMEPYIPAFFKTNSFFAGDLGIDINSDAHIIMAPNIGSYVGGDITAGTFASLIWNKPSYSLFIDLGTNGELVFGNEDFFTSCACSAGPAFEGGEISCGMRATDGAIEKCTIDPDTMVPSFSIIGDEGEKPVGLCGSGLIDLISELYKAGIISPKGKFIREGERVRFDKYGMGSYVVAFAEEAASVRDIEITEADIDNFIRAKGAIFSGIQTLISYVGFEIDMIDDVYVAGGIGSGINMRNAVNIGMFPDIPIEKFHYIGNSSLTGSYAMLISRDAERKVYDIAKNMTYIELSTTPGYMEEFVAACFIPHTDTSLFPSLQQ